MRNRKNSNSYLVQQSGKISRLPGDNQENYKATYTGYIFLFETTRGVLDLHNFVPIHARPIDWCSHSITMVAFTKIPKFSKSSTRLA